MKPRWKPILCRISSLAVLLLAVLIMGSCSSLRPSFLRHPDLIGTWQNRHGSQWSLRPDGTFEMRHGGFVVTGSYRFGNWSHRDQITLEYTRGQIPWDGHEPAIYRVKAHKQSLRFVPLHETCAIRMAALSTKWKRTEP